MSALSLTLATLVSQDKANAYLHSKGLPSMDNHAKALDLVVKSSGSKSQADVAALVINLTEGGVTHEQLTSVLKAAFPTDKVGDRHGPYYLSLARTGKLKGAEFQPGKRTAAPKATEPDPRVAELEQRIAALEAEAATVGARVALAMEAKSLKDAKAALEA